MTRALYKRPSTAWPTLLLLTACYAVWCLSFWLAYCGHYAASACLSVVAVYVAFTPMHEATHQTVSRRRWVNDAVGHLSAVFYGGPFVAFRFMHLQHHRFVNESADPDRYSGTGPWWMLPIRWATQDLHYYYLFPRLIRERPKDVPGLIVVMSLQFSVIACLIASGHLATFIFAWFLPMRVALFLVVLAFDYLPHRPHRVPARIDRKAATLNLKGAVLRFFFLNQSLHRVHHDFPAVPFYRYGPIYRERYEDAPASDSTLL